MSIADINNAATAMNQLKARYEDFLDDADAQIAARRAAYDGLSGDLVGLISNQMKFTAFVDPDDPAPTNVDGGVFNTIKEAIEAAPCGAYVTVRLHGDKTHILDNFVYGFNRSVLIGKYGGVERPIIDVVTKTSSSHNYVVSFRFDVGGALKFTDVDIAFRPFVDPNLSLSSDRSLISYHPYCVQNAQFDLCNVSGPDGVSLMNASAGCRVSVGMVNTVLDGPIFGVSGASFGACVISTHSLTLLNGAEVRSGGTTAGNVLQK